MIWILAEVGDKVATATGQFVWMMFHGVAITLFLALGLHVVSLPRCYLLPVLTLLLFLVLAWCTAYFRYFLWEIVDTDIRDSALRELGTSWLWQTRIAGWLGILCGIILGYQLRPVRWFQYLSQYKEPCRAS